MRRLAAVLACRAGSSRLYCKPLQNIAVSTTILGLIVGTLRRETSIAEIVLAIAEGRENSCFVRFAERVGLPHIIGDERDVLSRLIKGAEAVGATDVFRVTTESPFQWHEAIEGAWKRHLAAKNDITVTDNLPIGSHFELYTLEALRKSHQKGEREHRSELCSLYAREHLDQFRVEALWPPVDLRRPDIRLTVDFPEDLIVCRDLFALAGGGQYKLANIVEKYSMDPRFGALVAELPRGLLFWPGAPVVDA